MTSPKLTRRLRSVWMCLKNFGKLQQGSGLTVTSRSHPPSQWTFFLCVSCAINKQQLDRRFCGWEEREWEQQTEKRRGVIFYSKPARGGTGTSGKSLVCPLFPLLLFPSPPSLPLCSVFSPPLPCCEPGPPCGWGKGETGRSNATNLAVNPTPAAGVFEQLPSWPAGAPAAGGGEGEIGLPVFLTYGSRGERAAWDGRCLLQEQRGWSERGGGRGGGIFFFFFFFCCALVKIKLRIVCLYISFLDPAPGYLRTHK